MESKYYRSMKKHVLDKNMLWYLFSFDHCTEFSLCNLKWTVFILKTEINVLSIGLLIRQKNTMTINTTFLVNTTAVFEATQGVNIFQMLELACRIRSCFNKKTSRKLNSPEKFRGCFNSKLHR